jgi:hypothetical protein
MAKLKIKSKQKRFVEVSVWPDTKSRLARQAKHRKETLARYLDLLSNINQ